MIADAIKLVHLLNDTIAPTEMEILAILAIDERRGLGLNNHLPWHVPLELKHFKNVTSKQEPGEKQQNALIMGRKTFMGLPPLPDRLSIVISRYLKDSSTKSVVFVTSYETAIQAAIEAGCPRAFVIGGKKTLEYALMKAESRPTKVILSVIKGKHVVDTTLSREALSDYECVSVSQPEASAAFQVHTLVLKTMPTQ